jgi:hypothetical protein
MSVSNPQFGHIQWQSVESSNLLRVAYDAKGMQLLVQFRKTGRVYAYQNVDRQLFEDLVNADSVGKFFNEHIRNEDYHLHYEVTSLFSQEG